MTNDKVKDVNIVLWEYVKPESGSDFSIYHKKTNELDRENHSLEKFFHATLDEVRIYYASEYADLIIEGEKNKKNYFRSAVLKKETNSETEWKGQRDHAVHTLNNYILGWYLFTHSCQVRDELSKQIKIRLAIPVSDESEGAKNKIRDFFGKIWLYTSLMHDIGYILEGSINIMSTKIQSESVRQGANIIEDYFNHRFWYEVNLDSVSAREKLLELTKVDKPDFSNKSLAAVADSLFKLGELKDIKDEVLGGYGNKNSQAPNPLVEEDNLPSDTFDLWKKHYQVYGSEKMVNRLDKVKTAFEACVWEGLPKINLKMIDHGIASGLLLMLQSSYFLRIYYGLMIWKSKTIEKTEAEKGIVGKIEDNFKEDAYTWWSGIVWATAATAIHNIQQKPWPWPGCDASDYEGDEYKLKLDEDPLAYLGILVDILQEWDRYSVNPESIFSGKLPLQGQDITIQQTDSQLIINYHDNKIEKKVKDSLDQALHGWNDILNIETIENKSTERQIIDIIILS